jgi:hypothetical protein
LFWIYVVIREVDSYVFDFKDHLLPPTGDNGSFDVLSTTERGTGSSFKVEEEEEEEEEENFASVRS